MATTFGSSPPTCKGVSAPLTRWGVPTSALKMNPPGSAPFKTSEDAKS